MRARSNLSVTTDGAARGNGSHPDVAVVGAGPYGLSAAAHLRERGLQVAVFGKPMGMWQDHMPQSMLLRSYWWATSFSDPGRRYSLAAFCHETEQRAVDPLPIQTLVAYGQWFQRRAVPQVDETHVSQITRAGEEFQLTLADGRLVRAAVVIMALGLQYYAYRPTEYAELAPERVSHTSEHRTFQGFAGTRVAVIGGGQSALETAALLHESGADVHLITRRPIVWTEEAASGPRPLLDQLRRPQGGIGRGWRPWALEHFPTAFQHLPRSTKDRLLHSIAGPAGAVWLKPRLIGQVAIHEGLGVRSVAAMDGHVQISLGSNEVLEADHIMLGTGYRVNLGRLPMLHPALLAEVHTYQDAPKLDSHFESSVPGLHFIGISSVSSCGPLFRFVVGAEAAARRVTAAVVQRGASVRPD